MNWAKGATSIEADAVAEGFKISVKMHGLKFNQLIGKYFGYFNSNIINIMTLTVFVICFLYIFSILYIYTYRYLYEFL